ncbi:hypothetical protein VKT23_007485 [Stygiomarasmius scandens]|uniref:Uncharacterized protein n=1 Tax=Marasmiellus scandens TaxID=2682957 RepID=A0ABR1JKZ0_9AGAR
MDQLDYEQRQKLLKSTRKLQALLGTTPVIESDTSSYSNRRNAKFSLSLAPASTATRSLVLRLGSIPSSLAAPPPPSQPPSPLSPTFSNNSISRSASVMSKISTPPVDVRRKKMAKLARTLGENIPPELVFPESSSTSMRPTRPRSCSIDSFILIQASSPAPTPVSFDHLDHEDEEELEEKSSEHDLSQYASVFAASFTGSESEFSPLIKPFASREPSESSHHTVLMPAVPESEEPSPTSSSSSVIARKTSGFLRKARPRLDRSASTRSVSRPRANTRAMPGRSGQSIDLIKSSYASYTYDSPSYEHTSTHRKGREWSGQWNVDDMEQVVKNLRELKAR